MGVYYKNKQGDIKKIAGYLTQKVNARWFLCTRSLEDGQEYYDVPVDQTKDYFADISPFTVYSFGFNEPNTTINPKLRFKTEVYDIMDLTAATPNQLGIGQLTGVYQMFTQESEGDKTIYFIGDMHKDYENLESIYGRQVQLGLDGVIQNDRVVFTVQNADSYLLYRTNLHKFFLTAKLPLVDSSFQNLDRTLKVAIEFGDTIYNVYNYMLSLDTPLTIGDLMSTARYDQNTGFFFSFEATFFENSDLVGFAVIPPAIIALQLDNIIEDTDTVVTEMSEDGTRLSIQLSPSVVSKLARTLLTPTSPPSSQQLVSIDTTGVQKQLSLGTGLEVDNGTVILTNNGPFVSYTGAQTLTDEQKIQARENIGAAAAGGVVVINYSDVQGKPILDTSSTISLTPVENETINNTIKLHKVAKTGAAKDLNIDDQHNFITSTEKTQITTNAQAISDLSSNVAALQSGKFDKTGGTVTGDTTFTQNVTVQNMTTETLKATVVKATTQQPYVAVMDDTGNVTRRAINDLINDAGGSVVTVDGVRQASYEMNNKADQSALTAEVNARTAALATVNTHLTTLDKQIVALNTAINTEAETRETEIENVQTALNNTAKLSGENTFTSGQTIQGNVYIAGQLTIPNGPLTVKGIDITNEINNIKNNTTILSNSSGGFNAGYTSEANHGGAIGNMANTNGGGSAGANASSDGGFAGGFDARVTDGGAVGYRTRAGNGFSGGYRAQTELTSGQYIDAIQLGTGTNSTPKSLQVYNDNIYNAETHTLTVQNIESDSIPIGLPIGSIITSAVPLTDASVHLLDGSTISQTGIYADFVTYLKSQISAGYDLSCTQTEFDNDVQSTGNCGKFVIDDAAGTIRLPKITRFIQGLSSINDIGKSFSAGLPNIYGEINIPNGRSATGNSYFNVSGAFKYKENASQIGNAGDARLGGRIIIDANSGSSVSGIYGNSPTVQPQATQYPYYIVLTNSVKTDIVVDIDNVTTELNNISHELTNRVSKTDYNALGDFVDIFSGSNVSVGSNITLNESMLNFNFLLFRGRNENNGSAVSMVSTDWFYTICDNEINRLVACTDATYCSFIRVNDTTIKVRNFSGGINYITISGIGRKKQ